MRNDIFLSSSADICQTDANERKREVKNVTSIVQGLNLKKKEKNAVPH